MTNAVWSYEEAFNRNLGLVSPEEQNKLRSCRVAIVGQGGVGGIHLVTLARLGVGKFTIADPDIFEAANFNRQYGATVSTIGKSKVDVMRKAALDINPDLDIRVFKDPLSEQNIDHFLDGADVFLDGIDAFEINVRRMLFMRAHKKGLYSVTAGPIGFSTAWLVFDPKGMSFDEYFDISDKSTPVEKFASFLVGLVPKATHLSYMNLAYVDVKKHRGPSAGLACQMCAGVAAAEIVKILLGRGRLRCAPFYSQFDAYKGILKQGRLFFGNRHPIQQLKRFLLVKKLSSQFVPTSV